MRELIKRYWLFGLLMALDFYLPPLLIRDTGSGMFLLLIVIPAVCFVLSFVCGLKNGFHIAFPLFTAILFLPSIFLFYNESAWIYAPLYGIVSCAGELLSLLFRKKQEK